MKKIFQFFIAVVMCLSLSTNIYAINDNEHEITTDKPHIILTPNQAGDELTVKLHLSQEMFERQINYCILMADKLDVDLEDIVLKKLKKTEKKYPVEKAKGNSKKYNQL